MEFIYEVLENTNTNILVFIHDPYTDIEGRLYNIYETLNNLVRTKMKINNIKIYAYDASETKLHAYFYNVGNFKINSFHLFRGDRRDNRVYNGNNHDITGDSLTRFLLENCDMKFRIDKENIELGDEEKSLGFSINGIFDESNSKTVDENDETDL